MDSQQDTKSFAARIRLDLCCWDLAESGYKRKAKQMNTCDEPCFGSPYPDFCLFNEFFAV
jgi:hypothetical protein